ncbi:hypothetical protein EGR_10347 [Echinococcus granulosus]|uniref:Uncharacterized protein n=1 Tax=Echinococcus granulosus TaxID=6210 RepID=W6UMS1_ECHGR|nr:hypothetical protein EGR_10347 [Echinococcus granulosus]EUB54794.1 hypothetical protein EGR_10347 [Echinococcus granulosus]
MSFSSEQEPPTSTLLFLIYFIVTRLSKTKYCLFFYPKHQMEQHFRPHKESRLINSLCEVLFDISGKNKCGARVQSELASATTEALRRKETDPAMGKKTSTEMFLVAPILSMLFGTEIRLD